MIVCRSFLISGRVQGVWYRASTQRMAQNLEITGYAKNLPDGRVEVLAYGTKENVEALQKWLWEGPPNAEVNTVEEKTVAPCTPATFECM